MKDFELIYRKYKEQILPLVFIAASLFVLFIIILPQWSQIQTFKSTVAAESDTVASLKNNLSFLNSMPDDTVNNNYNILTTAVPIDKNILLIFNELNDAASSTNVKLGGFSVKVGGVYASTKTKLTQGNKLIAGIPYISISVSATGNTQDLKSFSEKLYESVPLVNIENVDIGDNNASYDVDFFFEPIVTSGSSTTQTLTPLSPTQTALLKKLNDWYAPPSG